MQVNLSLDQWQPLYEQLTERDSVVPLERQPDNVTVTLKDGTYVLSSRRAFLLLQNLRGLDHRDGIPDGVITRQWLLDYYVRQLGTSNLPILPTEAVSYEPTKEFIRLREALKNERLVVVLNGDRKVTDSTTADRFDLAVTTACYGGWTPEKLSEIKEAFRRVGAHPFYFSVHLDVPGSSASTVHLRDPADPDFPEGHYYNFNLMYPAENMTNVHLTAEHERIHGALWAYLARRYPTLLVAATGKVRRYQKYMSPYFGRFLHERLDSQLSPELRAGVGAALDGALVLFWLEESIVSGYHVSLRSEQLKSEYGMTIERFIHDLRSTLATPVVVDIPDVLLWASHDAALAFAIGRDDLAERIRSLIVETKDVVFRESDTDSSHDLTPVEVYDQMVTLHRLVMRTLHGFPDSPKIF